MEYTKDQYLADLQEIKGKLDADMETKADARIEEKLKAVNTAIDELKAIKPEVTADELKAIKSDLDATIKALDILQTRVKSNGFAGGETEKLKTFNDSLKETIEANAAEIKSFKKGGDIRFELKAVGDMTIAGNFPAATTLTQDVRTNMIEKPYNRVWLGDLLPQGQSTGTSIIYPKENGGEGGAAVWEDPTTDKPQIDFDLSSQTQFFKWLAGIVIIDREMLDDISFLYSYLQQKMLISLKIAENAFILNGTTGTNPVTGLLTAATAYAAGGVTYTNRVDKIIDAGWGQLVEGTFDFYNPTTTILTPRDAVSIGLNKSGGSGEYDLPEGSVAFANGQLQVGGIDVVRTTQIGTGNFLTFDKSATMFVKRMQPELRMFEDAALAKKNKIMFRVEERATLAIFNNKALIKGTL